MINSCMTIIWTGINACWDWICTLWMSVGLSFPTVAIAVLTASLALRYILMPVIGSGAQLPRIDIPEDPPVRYKETKIGFTWDGKK